MAIRVGPLHTGDGSRYIGEFKNGEPNGIGVCYYNNGDIYEGHWAGHAPHGRGIMSYTDGRKTGAIWRDGKFVKYVRPRNEHVSIKQKIVSYDPQKKTWALIIGISGYKHMPQLKFSDDDAYKMYAFLKSPPGGGLPDSQIKLLIDEEATRDRILEGMQDILLSADENDKVIVYFSGHGLEGSFLSIDYNGYNNRVWHDEVLSIMNASKAKHKVCLVDACYSGSLAQAENVFSKGTETIGGGSIDLSMLMSSKKDEVSLEDHGLRQGIFSHYLLKGLNGSADSNKDKFISLKELSTYVKSEVKQHTSGSQNPVTCGNLSETCVGHIP